jgi:hypothetical protein
MKSHARLSANVNGPPLMSSPLGPVYQAAIPPPGATCDSSRCRSAAKVRMIIPASRFEADGIDHDNDPEKFDACEWHWPGIRDTCQRNGYRVMDTTGSLRALAAEFPAWTIFYSDGGRLYASARIGGSRQGTTIDAYLVGQLRAQMQATVARQAAHHG